MSTITIPTSPGGWRRVVPVPSIKPKRRWESQSTLQTQTFLGDGEKFMVTLFLPPMIQATAALWTKFLRDAEIANDMFVLNLSDYLSTDISDRATAPCQLVVGSAQYERDRQNGSLFNVSFTVERAQ